MDAVEQLVEEFQKMPSIGRKTAQRLAFYVLQLGSEEAGLLARSILDVKEKVGRCSICAHVTEVDPCAICSDAKRDASLLCVVEQPSDVFALERTGEFRGRYHVLHGALSPLDGVGPDELPTRELVERLRDSSVEEVILATNPTVEGESTAVYLTRLIEPLDIRVTRLARGIPVGSDLEFVDQATLSRALAGRTEME